MSALLQGVHCALQLGLPSDAVWQLPCKDRHDGLTESLSQAAAARMTCMRCCQVHPVSVMAVYHALRATSLNFSRLLELMCAGMAVLGA